MDEVLRQFEERKTEVEEYVRYLELLEDDQTSLNTKNGRQEISKNFKNILIANSFLLLYNMIEATIRDVVLEIYECINSEKIPLDKLSDEMKNFWIHNKCKDKYKEEIFRIDTLRDFVSDFANKMNDDIIFDKSWMPFSGNLDARGIREILKKLGITEVKNGRNLVNIKNRRNKLAHGEQTFRSVGKDFSVQEITKLTKEVLKYLSKTIENTKTFINIKKYLKKGIHSI